MNDESGRATRVSNSRDAQAQSSGDTTQPSLERQGDVSADDQVSSTRSQSAVRQKAFFTSVDASLLGLGSQMMSEVAAGVLLGYGLDYLLGTKNRWIVVGSIAGIAVAMVTVFRLALKKPPPRPSRPGWRPKTPATGGTKMGGTKMGEAKMGEAKMGEARTEGTASKADKSQAQNVRRSSEQSGANAHSENSETRGQNRAGQDLGGTDGGTDGGPDGGPHHAG
jgi:F0F1-type ATP synthase assembly protein I